MNTNPESADPPKVRRCLVGNIVAWHWAGKGANDIRYGTKHFSPGTKVYCFSGHWGDKYEKAVVIGRHRGQSKLHRMIIPCRYITNWRSQLVYSPAVLRLMVEWEEVTHHSAHWGEQSVRIYLEWLRERDLEERAKDEAARDRMAEQAGTGQPATRPKSKSEGGQKPQPEAEGRSQ